MSETEAPKIDWGYPIDRFIDEARRAVSTASNPEALIGAKLEEADAGHKIGGGEGIRIVQDRRNEARALIAACIEKSVPELKERTAPMAVLELALSVEDLRRTSAFTNQYAHQAQLETVCYELSYAVMFLLGQQLVQSQPQDSPEQKNNPQQGGGE